MLLLMLINKKKDAVIRHRIFIFKLTITYYFVLQYKIKYYYSNSSIKNFGMSESYL